MAVVKKLIVANWKLNPTTLAEAKKIFLATKAAATTLRNIHTVVCPPYVYLSELSHLYKGSRLSYGAQDVYAEEKGAFTGMVSAPMVASVGARYVIIGHSERRAMGDTNEIVDAKIRAALKQGLTTIVCVGEKERDHGGEYLSFLREQMHSAFRSVTRAQLQNMIIAYEPIYAIGKGADSAISSEDLHQTSLYLRKILTERYDRATALAVPLLYGGSVKANNTLALLEEGFVDGLLVGSASVAPKEFQEILRLAASLPVTTH